MSRVRAEFYRLEQPTEVVGWAWWGDRGGEGGEGGFRDRGALRVQALDDDGRARLARIFRRTPVVAVDASLRTFGTSGPNLLQPGSLRWFLEAAGVRSAAEGLGVRFVADDRRSMGWDPAGAYRPFTEAIERKARGGDDPPRAPAPASGS